ncbi:hypothetical protein DFH09DRAFT_1095367 [Mycena vulgaris]|nr:hypothetical protein DFH09DRAFT_1095367 [Mycena vulgaris]
MPPLPPANAASLLRRIRKPASPPNQPLAARRLVACRADIPALDSDLIGFKVPSAPGTFPSASVRLPSDEFLVDRGGKITSRVTACATLLQRAVNRAFDVGVPALSHSAPHSDSAFEFLHCIVLLTARHREICASRVYVCAVTATGDFEEIYGAESSLKLASGTPSSRASSSTRSSRPAASGSAWENNTTNDPSIELTLGEVKALAREIGFPISEVSNAIRFPAVIPSSSVGMTSLSDLSALPAIFPDLKEVSWWW